MPKPRFEYRSPSILAEHKYLALLFILAIVAAIAYLFWAPHKPIRIDPPPPPPVYVEPLSQQQTPVRP